MKKALSLFILLFIFSCTSSDNSSLKPNDSDKNSNLSTTETNNKRIPKGLYYGSLKVSISNSTRGSKELPEKGVSISFLEDGSLYSEIFDNSKVPSGVLKQKTDGSYYGEYNNTSTSTTYEIAITVLTDTTINVKIITIRNADGSKDITTYIGNLSR